VPILAISLGSGRSVVVCVTEPVYPLVTVVKMPGRIPALEPALEPALGLGVMSVGSSCEDAGEEGWKMMTVPTVSVPEGAAVEMESAAPVYMLVIVVYDETPGIETLEAGTSRTTVPTVSAPEGAWVDVASRDPA